MLGTRRRSDVRIAVTTSQNREMLTRMPFGRDNAEWSRLVQAAEVFLIEQARLGKVTSYTELNTVLARRTGATPFDFGQDGERRAMGALLEEVGERNRPETGVMITALVSYLNENDAGPGFFAYAQRVGLLRSGATADERLEFWASQVRASHDHYS
jgi:hypothetical protein